jgi:hypothetical protein
MYITKKYNIIVVSKTIQIIKCKYEKIKMTSDRIFSPSYCNLYNTPTSSFQNDIFGLLRVR